MPFHVIGQRMDNGELRVIYANAGDLSSSENIGIAAVKSGAWCCVETVCTARLAHSECEVLDILKSEDANSTVG